MTRHIVLFVCAIAPWIFFSSPLFLSDPPILQDEAIIFDTSATLAKTGKLASTVYGGLIPRMEKHSFGYPPLYYYLLAGWIRLFGDTVEAGRSLSLLFGALTLAIFYILVLRLTSKIYFAAMATLLLSVDFFFGGASRTIRMDIVAVFFILSAVMNASRSSWISGLFSGLAILTHPLGLLAPIGVLFFSRPRKIASLLIPVGISLFLWLLTILPAPDVFWEQMMMQIRAKELSPYAVLRMWQNGGIDQLYSIIVLFIVAICAYYRRCAFFLISVLIVIVSKEQLYFVYTLPFLYLSLVLIFSSTRMYVFPLILLIAALNIIYDTQALIRATRETGYHEFAAMIIRQIPPSSTVLLASHPDIYFDLRRDPRYTLIEYPMVLVPPNSYDRVWKNADYIVANLENEELSKFINQRRAASTRVTSPGGTQTWIIQVKPY